MISLDICQVWRRVPNNVIDMETVFNILKNNNIGEIVVKNSSLLQRINIEEQIKEYNNIYLIKQEKDLLLDNLKESVNNNVKKFKI